MPHIARSRHIQTRAQRCKAAGVRRVQGGPRRRGPAASQLVSDAGVGHMRPSSWPSMVVTESAPVPPNAAGARVGYWLIVPASCLAVAGSYFLSFFYGAVPWLVAYLCVALPALGVAVPRLATCSAPTRRIAAAASALCGAVIVATLFLCPLLPPLVLRGMVAALATLV